MNILEKWEALRKIVEVNYDGNLITNIGEISFRSSKTKNCTWFFPFETHTYIEVSKFNLQINKKLKHPLEIIIGYNYFYNYCGVSFKNMFLYHLLKKNNKSFWKDMKIIIFFEDITMPYSSVDMKSLMNTLGMSDCENWLDEVILNLL